ncbi:MAG: hypothetical protein HY328_13720 [Chloroflexi bacterium]|nr:hypothetical protein [Chloroflexota bacterium]
MAAHPDTVRQALTFAYQIDDGPEVARIDLVGPGEELLDTLPLSASSPEITLTHPVSGVLFPPATASVDLAWDARDADGDDLLYSVFYSPDDGVTWLDRSLEQSESGHRLALQPHTTRHSAKVIVTDGVRSREALVRFTVTQQLFLPNITR